ncbi:MAG: hypothetical protein ACK5HY_12705, partial [Parahaliea sp.]
MLLNGHRKTGWVRSTLIGGVLLAMMVLASPVMAQATVSNTATISPPAGVTDPDAGTGCSSDPLLCTGNNKATDEDTVHYTLTVVKALSHAADP